MSCTVSKGTDGLGNKKDKELEVDSTESGPATGVGRGADLLQKKILEGQIMSGEHWRGGDPSHRYRAKWEHLRETSLVELRPP